VPDSIQDFYREHYGNSATAATLTHCKRELVHAVLAVILNDRFIDAYRQGFLLKCGDGLYRRLFPRLLIYSADYPEKCVRPFLLVLTNALTIPFMAESSSARQNQTQSIRVLAAS
jgi:Plavaka transposase